jgi:hypothetical protein
VFVFGVDATRTPVEDDIRMEPDPARLGDGEESGSSPPAGTVPAINVVFDVNPKLGSALDTAVDAVITVLLPEFSITGCNGGGADCWIKFGSNTISFCSYPVVSIEENDDTVCGLLGNVLGSCCCSLSNPVTSSLLKEIIISLSLFPSATLANKNSTNY